MCKRAGLLVHTKLDRKVCFAADNGTNTEFCVEVHQDMCIVH